MMNIQMLSNLFRQLSLRIRTDWPRWEALLVRRWWLGFNMMSGLVLAVFAWPVLTWFSGVVLLLVLGALVWTARRWLAMQATVVLMVLCSSVALLTTSTDLLSSLLLPVMVLLLLASVVLAMVFDWGNTRLSDRHVSYACWSVIGSGVLLLVLRGLSRPAASLHYAGLPLTGVDDFLIGTVVVMVFLYLLFQRTHSRVRGVFIGLLPATLCGVYLMLHALGQDVSSLTLPDVVLEHGLLLIHVPAMVLAFALLLNAAGFALLRLFSDTAWLRARQNADIIETIQTSLEDYLYRVLVLAVMAMGVGLVSGMWWSNLAWGHYWQSEPKQLLSLAAWLYYLAGLHLRLQKGMQMRPFAWWCLAGLPLLVLCLLGTNLWPAGLHHFVD